MPRLTIDQRWRWWREQLGSPRFVMAPMVLQSELAFRQLARRHGCELCYSPMVPVASFLSSREAGEPEHPETGGPQTREAWVTSSRDGTDRPLLVQLGGSDVDKLLAAARLVQDRCDGIDLNLGCPQRCAEQGGYGAFLLTRPDHVRQMVETLVAELAVPVTVKIRVLPELADTLAFARMLQDAGAAAVAVHGRRREQRHHEGPADWDTIAAIKEALDIPVIANGNVRTRADAERCLAVTGCDAVMSATALLSNPRLFASPEPPLASCVPAASTAPSSASAALVAADDRAHERQHDGQQQDGGAASGARGGLRGRRWRDGVPTLLCRLEMALEYTREADAYPAGALPRMVSDHVLALLRHDHLEKADAAAEPIKLIKAWRSVRTPAQYAHLVAHLAARLGLLDEIAAADRARPPGRRLLRGPVQPLVTIVLGGGAGGTGGAGRNGAHGGGGVLRELSGAELTAVSTRLRRDLKRFNARAAAASAASAGQQAAAPSAAAAAAAEKAEAAAAEAAARLLVQGAEQRLAGQKQRQSHHDAGTAAATPYDERRVRAAARMRSRQLRGRQRWPASLSRAAAPMEILVWLLAAVWRALAIACEAAGLRLAAKQSD